MPQLGIKLKKIALAALLAGGSVVSGPALGGQTSTPAAVQAASRSDGSYALTPESPAREYIYLADRLLAFDEAAWASAPSPPTNLRALPCFGRKISLLWNDNSANESGFRLERKEGVNGVYALVWDSLAPNAGQHLDAGSDLAGGLDPARTYYYRVKAYGASGESVPSNEVVGAPGLPFLTDGTIVPQSTIIRAAHVTELRQAVNAVRACADLPPFNGWTDASLQGAIIKAIHIQQLRDQLRPALSTLGLTPPQFSDDPLTAGALVKKKHLDEVRQAVQ